MIWKLIKLLVVLALIAVLALISYAYLGPIFLPGDFDAPQVEIRQPVELDLSQ